MREGGVSSVCLAAGYGGQSLNLQDPFVTKGLKPVEEVGKHCHYHGNFNIQ